MTSHYDVLRRPIITEKSNYQLTKLNQVVFEVSQESNKTLIKEAIETVFDVKVVKVNVMVMPAKQSKRASRGKLQVRKKSYKKAIITLADGDSIDLFEGVR